MAIITTYVCDVSGKQGNKEDFVEVRIQARPLAGGYKTDVIVIKTIHEDVAEKLHLLARKPPEDAPVPTLESQLSTLLKDYIDEIVYDTVEGMRQQ